MTIYRFENPIALILIIFPVLSLLVFISSKIIFKKGVKTSGISNIKRSLSIKVVGYYISVLSVLSGLFLITFSISKPQFGYKFEKIVSEGIDIMISLDVSASMKTNDFLKQSRIDGAKNILIKFINKRKGDRIGLVTFEESSHLKCPTTLNYNLLKNIINKINIDDSKKQKLTAIGIGLASSINRLVKINIKNDETKSTKIVILLTDGINNTGEISPEAATEIACAKGIKIYTVGIGRVNDIDIPLLKYVADKTGGKFFHANTSGELGPAFEEINELEKNKYEIIEYARYKNLGYKLSVIGILMLLTGLILNSLFFRRLL